MAKYNLLGLLIYQLIFFSSGKHVEVLYSLRPDPISYYSDFSFKVKDGRNNVIEDIHFRFYNGKTFSENMDVKLADAVKILQQKEFSVNNETIFYVHGWGEDADRESVETVVTAYLQHRPDINIILVDWSNMAGGSYMTNAALNTRPVAVAVANELMKMMDKGLQLETIHVVGHSLGGQVAGFIGKNIRENGIMLKRISALDPAFPMFYPGLVLGHISHDDAEFVDVIHTAAYEYGAPVSTGTVDFWPNGGHPKQPGCKIITIPLSPDDMCSHWRSWMYWAESVGIPKAFPTRIAASNANLVTTDTIYMGHYADTRARGDYFLETNSQYPFGKNRP